MKKLLIQYIPVLLTMVVFTFNSSANTSLSTSEMSSVAGFDEAEIYNAFTEIDDLVNYVSVNQEASFAEVLIENSSLLLRIDDESAVAFKNDDKFTFTPGLAYFSGCVFGPLGIVLVAIVNNGDEKGLRSAIWGFVTSGCVTVSSVVIFYVFFFSYYSFLYW